MAWLRWQRHLCLFFLYWFAQCGKPLIQGTSDDESNEATVTSSSVSEEVVLEKIISNGPVDMQQDVSSPTPSLSTTSSFTDDNISDKLDTNSLVITQAVAPATPWEDQQLTSSAADVLPEKVGKNGGEKVLESDLETQEVNERDKENQKSDKVTNDIDEIEKNLDQTKPAEVSTSTHIVSEGGYTEEKTSSELNEDLEKDKANGVRNVDENEQELISDNDRSAEQNDKINELSEETNEMMDGNADESPSPENEDMPSFKEWSEKFLAQEEEKNKVQQKNEKGSTEANSVTKKKKSDRKQNNYASLDCGAKILEKNMEARNAESILLENKDLYMLNPCSANIWFIVELCDHAHVTSLQLANFEMFSSTTEKFQVSFSTRYPTREWKQLQTFTAKSEKVVQTFTLDPIFAKYIKVEQLSHHGSEHYCPWSLLRVYGNSMVEEYEDQESSHDAESNVDEDESVLSDSIQEQQDSNGILHTATEVVLNFVKETAKKLVTTPGTNDSSNANDSNSTTSPNVEDQKTIVQLMDRADFEAEFCQEGLEEPSLKCGPEVDCGFTTNTAHSYKMFFEMVHNVCHHDRKVSQACLTNSSILLNKTIEKDSKMDQDKNVVVKVETKVEETPLETETDNLSKLQNTKEPESGESKTNEISDNVQLKQDAKESQPHTVIALEASAVENGHHETSTLSTSSSATIVPSQSSSTSGSASSSAVSDDVQCPPSPTPLAQPPLAVDQQPVPDNIVQSDQDVPKPDENLTTSFDSSATSKQLPGDTVKSSIDKLSSSEQLILNKAETISGESVITIAPSESSVVADPPASVSMTKEIEIREDEMGKEVVDENVNRHVDVLKIRLTDDKTKEGTAELEGSGDIPIQEGTQEDTLSEKHVTDHVIISGVASRGKSDIVSEDLKTFDVLNNSETKHDSITAEKESMSSNDAVKVGDVKVNPEDESYKKSQDSERISSGDVDEGKDATQIEMENKYLPPTTEETCGQKEYENHVRQDKFDGGLVTSEAVVDLSQNAPVLNGEQNNKKESVFVAMSRKIKGLEQNVTMTNLFLEELSQRYRKSLDEMQKKMEKKLTAVTKNSKFLANVNSHQNTTILALTTKVEELERDLKQVNHRLQLINQEVIERHLIGMCLQFFIILVLFWFLIRRSRSSSQPTPHLNNGCVPLENGKVLHDYDHVFDEAVKDKRSGSIEEFKLPKTPELLVENKRRRRRRQRSGTADHLLMNGTSVDQNIVTQTAGLIFHTPGCHGDDLARKQDKVAERSVSLHDLGRNSPEQQTMRRATSPKLKKPAFRSGGRNAGARMRLFGSEDSSLKDIGTECENSEHKRLSKTKSLDGNEVTLCSNTLGSCSLESGETHLQNSKGRWIWGLG